MDLLLATLVWVGRTRCRTEMGIWRRRKRGLDLQWCSLGLARIGLAWDRMKALEERRAEAGEAKAHKMACVGKFSCGGSARRSRASQRRRAEFVLVPGVLETELGRVTGTSGGERRKGREE